MENFVPDRYQKKKRLRINSLSKFEFQACKFYCSIISKMAVYFIDIQLIIKIPHTALLQFFRVKKNQKKKLNNS